MTYTPASAVPSSPLTIQNPEKRIKIAPKASILDVAEHAGISFLNPSDLVFESNVTGITYYDFVISGTRQSNGNYQLFLSKFDSDTNLEWMESTDVANDVISSHDLPNTDLTMILLGVLTWKTKIQKCKVLCLVETMDIDSTQTLEALKTAAEKFRFLHHVISINERKISMNGHEMNPRRSRSHSPQDGMRLRVMMCQSRTHVELPTQAIRETRCLLFPKSHPLLCLCFHFTSFTQ